MYLFTQHADEDSQSHLHAPKPTFCFCQISPLPGKTGPQFLNTMDEFMTFILVELCGKWSFVFASVAQLQVITDPVFSRLCVCAC